MQANSWHHKLFRFHLSIWIWKVWKRKKKLQKFEYLENEKSFPDEIKNIFHSIWRGIISWKNKNSIKNSGHKLYTACQWVWEKVSKHLHCRLILETLLRFKIVRLSWYINQEKQVGLQSLFSLKTQSSSKKRT